MCSGVPGLLTFITVSDGVLEMTSELPTLIHVMVGSGLPDALQNNEILFPSITVSAVFSIFTDVASAKIILGLLAATTTYS